MTVQYAHAHDITIAYETFGDPAHPAALLIAGLGAQMLAWEDAFCDQLAAAGFHVIRFDNRDIGLSTHLHAAGKPGVQQYLNGQPVTESAYLLADMADDAAALLRALGITGAHIIGTSMGGMIAQEFAIRHPEMTLSLASIFSTPSHRIGGPTKAAWAALMAPPGKTPDAAAENAVKLYRVIGSPEYPLDEVGIRRRAAEEFRRASDPHGVLRQLIAVQASPDRRAALGAVTAPTLVIHGEADPLVQLPGGEATAAAIAGAKLVTFPGMGHDLPEALWPRILDEITGNANGN